MPSQSYTNEALAQRAEDMRLPPTWPRQHQTGAIPPNKTANWKDDLEAEERAIAARRILPRDPCFRCGARGDIGCGCPKQRLGWRVG